MAVRSSISTYIPGEGDRHIAIRGKHMSKLNLLALGIRLPAGVSVALTTLEGHSTGDVKVTQKTTEVPL